ncbi:MAG: type II secretion system minor pseudopilin GspK [Deltaproteobacteria bacterium]|nr:type II secretion system minor pseudopilin GspK [Deltaproteobacteria bacterium]MBV8451898.1 type II secretion system minor pseudopilin GspK [Deltaproteobacteria bacterium]
MKPRHKYDRGIALLATLLAVSLMTLLVVEFSTSAALEYRAAANQANELRAYYLARSGIEVGLAVLVQDSLSKSRAKYQYVSLDQVWAQPIAPIPVEGGTVSMSIVDEDRKLDINKLFDQQKREPDPLFAAIFTRLLSNVGLSPALVPILIDWLDPDSIESDGGAEADYYLRLMPPYEPRNAQMPTIGDLRMLKGMDDVTFLRLSRYLTTMQIGAGPCCINVNTAPPEVLAALAPELEDNADLVKQIIDVRDIRPFRQITDFLNLPGISAISEQLKPFLTINSEYFQITAQGDFAGARKRIYAIFRRNLNGTALLMNWHED